MRLVIYAIALAIVSISIASAAVEIHTEKMMTGIGYSDLDLTIETNEYLGHGVSIVEKGSGSVNDTIRIGCDTMDNTLTVHTAVSKEYSPVIYNNETYNSLWKFNVLTRNYMAGAAVNSEYSEANSIDERSDWLLNGNTTSMTEDTKYVGKRHFGIRVVDPHDVTKVIMESFEDSVGLFVEERAVVIARNETPHTTTLGCP